MSRKIEAKRPKGAGWKLVYDTIRAEILTLTLAPGQTLDEVGLADRFDLSRSPVREALIRLSGEGLVMTLPNRTTIVAPIEMTAFPKYIEALDVVQRMNTRLAAELRTDSDLKVMDQRQHEFEAAVKSGDHSATSEANKEFHMAIARAGKNPYLADFYERLLDQGRRMLHLHFAFLGTSYKGYLLTEEHRKIFDAIEANDIELADSLAHAHTVQFRDNFVNFMTKSYTTDVALGPPPVVQNGRGLNIRHKLRVRTRA